MLPRLVAVAEDSVVAAALLDPTARKEAALEPDALSKATASERVTKSVERMTEVLDRVTVLEAAAREDIVFGLVTREKRGVKAYGGERIAVPRAPI